MCFLVTSIFLYAPQWGAADTEIEVPSGESTELKRSPFKAWCRSVFLAHFYSSGPFTSIFFTKVFPVLAVANAGSFIGLQYKIGLPAGCRFPW